jgi:organic hydroperoxide reductase OsmC/OhrA
VLDEYMDDAVGHMEKNAEGRLAITRVTLIHRLKFSGEDQRTEPVLLVMYHAAREDCFIGISVKTEVTVETQM